MQAPFLVCKFGKDTLSNLVRERFGDNFPDIVSKFQVQYIFTYLKGLNAQSILMESEYVDGDYLEDYSRYYVKCFNRYGERCARLHFFSSEVQHTQIEEGIIKKHKSLQKELQKNYLGFMVIKPLPKTFIGKTCLRVDPDVENSQKKKILAKNYDVNLFGLQLSVRSLPFQEQDKVVSACATTAIWSLLHAQKSSGRYSVPSSSEITLSAINHIDNSSNSFPNKGLSNKQILRAIDTQGYRNHKFDFERNEQGQNTFNPEKFFDIIKPYLDSNIPMILGCDVYSKNDELDDIYQKKGGHAVSILGYKDNENGKAVYIHDDRFGPYTRALIHTSNQLNVNLIEYNTTKNPCLFLSLHHKGADNEWLEATEILVPDTLIVPTHPKVRLPITKIKNTCEIICKEFTHYYESTHNRQEEIIYEIELVDLHSFRERVISNKSISNRYDILSKNSPRFLWLTSFRDTEGESIFDIAFDATDIPQGEAIAHLVIYNDEDLDIIKNVMSNEQIKARVPQSSVDNFFPNFIRALKPKLSEFDSYLNSTYGEPRAPVRLKPEETLNGQLHPQGDEKRKIFFGRSHGKITDAFKDVDISTKNLIWAISLEGALLIGFEEGDLGHPTLTGYKCARIAGELKRTKDGWLINSKSGRYSGDYKNRNQLLKNAQNKFLEVFFNEKKIECSLYNK